MGLLPAVFKTAALPVRSSPPRRRKVIVVAGQQKRLAWFECYSLVANEIAVATSVPPRTISTPCRLMNAPRPLDAS